MRVLITGCTGFVGSHLASAWSEQPAGVDVHGTSRSGRWRSDSPHAARVALHAIDLFDGQGYDRLLASHPPDVVVHLAGYANPSDAKREPDACRRANVEGTMILLESIRRAGLAPRLLFASSGAVYGHPTVGPVVFDESFPAANDHPYARSKADAEEWLVEFASAWPMPIIRMRMFNSIGPGQPLGYIVTDVAKEIADLERRPSPRRLRNRNLAEFRNFLDVRDTVRAILGLAQFGIPGEAYNIASKRTVQLIEVVEVLRSLASVPIEDDSVADRRPSPYEVSTAKIAALIGWAPRYTLEDSFRAVLDEWRQRSP